MANPTHVNTLPAGYWFRCESVDIQEGQLLCALNLERIYSFMDAYHYAPHMQFVNMEKDADLVRFVRTYGPLESLTTQGPTKYYWSFRDWLKALMNLIRAFKNSRELPQGLRKALLEFLIADMRQWEVTGIQGYSEFLFVRLLSRRHGVSEEPDQWVPQASVPLVQEAVAYCVNHAFAFNAGFQATLGEKGPEIKASFKLDDLLTALKWMTWQDEFRQRPLGFCEECGNAFLPVPANKTKFCSYACGHLVAARAWQRRKSLKRKNRRR